MSGIRDQISVNLRGELQTEVIRKGKASKPTEFGKMAKIQEAEPQTVTHYEVCN